MSTKNLVRIGRALGMVLFLLLGNAVSVVAAPGDAPPSTPVAVDDNFSIVEDTTLNGNVKTNDLNLRPNADAILVTGPAHAQSFTLATSGAFTYVPEADYTGLDTFTYGLRLGDDSAPLETPGTVTITINPAPEPPVAVNDGFTFFANTVLNATSVLANDTDLDTPASGLSAEQLTNPSNGVVSAFTAAGTFTYTPNNNYVGLDSFTYRVSDGALTDTGTVNLTIQAPPCGAGFTGTFPNCILINAAPISAADSFNGTEDTVLNGTSVLANDSDPESVPLTAVLGTTTGKGLLNLNLDGTFTYTPNANTNGADSFTYRASDGVVLGPLTTVSLMIAAVNDAPVAVNDSGYSVVGNSALTGASSVLGNDSDIESSPLSAVLEAGPSHGDLTLAADGTFNYTPDLGYVGSDSFTYRADDGSLQSNIATVSITVTMPPLPPIAAADSYSTNEDTALSVLSPPGILANDSDPNGDSISAEVVDNPANGSLSLNPDGTFTYTPNANFAGTDSFTYKASDGTLESSLQTVTITVNQVNDAPVAVADSYSVVGGSTLLSATSVLTNDTDAEPGPLTATQVSGSGPANGSLSLASDGTFTYTPDFGFLGSDSFTYTARDGGGLDSAPATVTINVTAPLLVPCPAGFIGFQPTCIPIIIVNLAPVAQADTYSIDEDTVLNGTSVLANDLDPELLDLDVVLDSTTSNGDLLMDTETGTFTYTPDANFHGSDSFTYHATTGGTDNSLTVTASITVNPVNDVPEAAPAAFTVVEDGSITEDLVAGSLTIPSITTLEPQVDLDGDPITAQLVTEPTHGSIEFAADGTFTYTPDANYFGPDSFTYSVSDDALVALLGSDGVSALAVSSPATVALTITPVNDAPVALNDSGTWTTGTLTLNVLANDSDIDGTLVASSVTVISSPSHGAASVNAAGQIGYVATLGFAGTDSLTYRVCDNEGACDTALVNITVAGVQGVQITPALNDTGVKTVTQSLGSVAQTAIGSGGQLPATGVETIPLLLLALGFMLEGAIILKVDRRRYLGRRIA